MRLSGYIFVLVAAALWATLGIFYKGLIAAYGLPPAAIVFWRALIAALALFFALAVWRRPELGIRHRDLPFFLAFGLFGVAGFFLIYAYAVSLSGVGVAAVLLYTAPAWVMLFSVLFWGENLDWPKGAAVLMAILGAALIGQIYRYSAPGISLAGLLAGLGAGLGYAAYILFNKAALRKNYPPWTVMAYGLFLGAIFMIPAIPQSGFTKPAETPAAVPWLLLLGLIPTLGGSLAFNLGLQKIPATNASIVATLEPLIAVLLGWLVFSERLEPIQLLGGVLIIASVVLLQMGSKSE